jgi:hypothetical protein
VAISTDRVRRRAVPSGSATTIGTAPREGSADAARATERPDRAPPDKGTLGASPSGKSADSTLAVQSTRQVLEFSQAQAQDRLSRAGSVERGN